MPLSTGAESIAGEEKPTQDTAQPSNPSTGAGATQDTAGPLKKQAQEERGSLLFPNRPQAQERRGTLRVAQEQRETLRGQETYGKRWSNVRPLLARCNRRRSLRCQTQTKRGRIVQPLSTQEHCFVEILRHNGHGVLLLFWRRAEENE